MLVGFAFVYRSLWVKSCALTFLLTSMRSQLFEHTEDLRRAASFFWRNHASLSDEELLSETGSPLRPTLSIPRLLKLLQVAVARQAHDTASSQKGKRRAVGAEEALLSTREAKKHHTSMSNLSASNCETDESVRHPVSEYSFELRYTRNGLKGEAVEQHYADHDVWVDEEQALLAVTRDIDPESGSPILLGEVYVFHINNYMAIAADVETARRGLQDVLLLLPSFAWPDEIRNPAFYGYDSPESLAHKNFLYALHCLETSGRVSLLSTLQFVSIPTSPGEAETNEMPFILRLHIEVSLLSPRILNAIIYRGAKKQKQVNQLRDIQRRLMFYLFSSNKNQDSDIVSLAARRQIDIPVFYSMLGPAPMLGSPDEDQRMQPIELQSQLLPFQRRSVAWLLRREGKGKAEEFGSTLPLFWSEVRPNRFSNATWFFNHLSGEIQAERPESHEPLGGILAEEPGLGWSA